MKLGRLFAIIILVALMAAAALFVQSSVMAQSAVRIGHNKVWSNAALEISRHRDYYSPVGVKVEWKSFRSPNKILAAIAAGELDGGAVTVPNYLTAIEKGIKVRAVALLQGSSEPPIAYFVRKDSGISKVTDLRGKRMGVNNFGGNYDLYARAVLARHGLNPKTDVKWNMVPVPAILPSLLKGKIDVGPLAAIGAAIAMKKYGDKLKVLFDYTDVDPEKASRHNSMILVFSAKFIAQQRADAVKFLRGYLKAARWVNANQQAALQAWSEANGVKAVKLLPRTPTVPDSGKIFIDAVQVDADISMKFGYLKKKVNARAVIDDSLVSEAARGL